MKKFLIISAFVIVLALGIHNVSGQETTSTTTYMTLTNNQTSTTNESVYYYFDYQDLINQIYNDVYSDLYDELYNDLMNSLNDDMYDEIYGEFEALVQDFLDNKQFDLYVDELQDMIFDVVEIADDSVLGVANYLGNSLEAVGSGVVYKYDENEGLYYLITNEHVIAKGNKYTVVFSDGTEYNANLIGFDVEVDIAILTFSAPDRTNILVSELGSSFSLAKGTILIAAGNPQGFNFYGSVTLGIVSGLNRKVDTNQYVDYVQHDSAINPGNSGGPVYNLDGEVIGINVAKLADTSIEGIGFAIPIDMVKRIIARIEAGNLPANTIMPRIGAKYYDIQLYYNRGKVSVANLIINGELRTDKVTLTLPNELQTGFLVYEVTENQTLFGSPIRSGDIIYQINDFVITSQKDYYNYMYYNHEAGDILTFYYYELNHLTEEYDVIPKSVDLELK